MGRAARLTPVIGLTLAYAVVHHLGRTYGSTRQERASVLPGDELVPEPFLVCTHATTIAAPPEAIWPWLVQVGWHRGGWYTARWVDRLLFPANLASADMIIPELQHLDVGDFIPDGPPETECGFVVQQLRPREHLVLRSDSHLPLSWRARLGARIDWTWTFVLLRLPDGGGTRFIFRWRARADPLWVRVLSWAGIVPADLLMSRDMMRGLRSRVEHRS